MFHIFPAANCKWKVNGIKNVVAKQTKTVSKFKVGGRKIKPKGRACVNTKLKVYKTAGFN